MSQSLSVMILALSEATRLELTILDDAHTAAGVYEYDSKSS